jgi:hypothetical protein
LSTIASFETDEVTVLLRLTAVAGTALTKTASIAQKIGRAMLAMQKRLAADEIDLVTL